MENTKSTASKKQINPILNLNLKPSLLEIPTKSSNQA